MIDAKAMQVSQRIVTQATVPKCHPEAGQWKEWEAGKIPRQRPCQPGWGSFCHLHLHGLTSSKGTRSLSPDSCALTEGWSLLPSESA